MRSYGDVGGLCQLCKYWRPGLDNPRGIQTCKAFPDGIPDQIFSGAEMHFDRVRGDNGGVFAPDDDVTPEMVSDFLGLKKGYEVAEE